MPKARVRRVGSIKVELINKSREAVLAAVQIFEYVGTVSIILSALQTVP